MKVAFLGNVNNHPFIVSKHFKDKGAEVIFFVEADKSNKLYRPESTGLVSFPYPDWIEEVPKFENAIVIHFPNLFARKIIQRLNECDAVILNNYAHRIIPFLNKKIIKICMFTGADLEVMADFENVKLMKMNSGKLKLLPLFLKNLYASFSVRQLRSAIKKSDLIGYFPPGLNPIGDKLLSDIYGKKPYNRYNHWCIMLDGIHYTPPVINSKIRILNLARFMWKLPFPNGTSSGENKRNDLMIEGLGNFLKDYPDSIEIHLVEKGLHVQESKDLIEHFNFTQNVIWHKEMPLNELIQEIIKSDIIFDQLGEHLFGAGILGMAVGRPLIANARPEILSQISGKEIPVCHSVNANDVYYWLKKLVFDKDLRISKGIQSSEFAFKFMDIRNESEYYYNFIKKYRRL